MAGQITSISEAKAIQKPPSLDHILEIIDELQSIRRTHVEAAACLRVLVASVDCAIALGRLDEQAFNSLLLKRCRKALDGLDKAVLG